MSKQQEPPIAVAWDNVPLAGWQQLAPMVQQRGYVIGSRTWLAEYAGVSRERARALSRRDLEAIRKDGEAWVAGYRSRTEARYGR
jgi:hypothetical protein